MRLIQRLAVAAAALSLSAGAAAAATAVAEADLNVRAGPGTNFPVVGVVPDGAPVEVINCSGSWCRIAFSAGTGYASRSYLDLSGGTVGRVYAPRVVAPAPVYGYYDEPDYYGPSVGYGVGVYSGPRYYRGEHRGNWRGRDGNWAGRSGDRPGRGDWTNRRGGNPGGPAASGKFSGGGRANVGATFQGGRAASPGGSPAAPSGAGPEGAPASGKFGPR